MINLSNIPNNSRCWIFQSTKELSNEEVNLLKEKTQLFLNNWAAHGSKMSSFAEIAYNRFLIVFADENITQASGCSIDTLMQHVQKVQQEINTDFFDRLQIAYLEKELVKTCNLTEFEALIKSGILDGNSTVFNNMPTTKQEFVNSWKTSIKNSWHSRYLQPEKTNV